MQEIDLNKDVTLETGKSPYTWNESSLPCSPIKYWPSDFDGAHHINEEE